MMQPPPRTNGHSTPPGGGSRMYTATRFQLVLPERPDRVRVTDLTTAFEKLGNEAMHLTLGNDMSGLQRLTGVYQFVNEAAVPANPPAGEVKMYSRGGILYQLESTGLEQPLPGGGNVAGSVHDQIGVAAGTTTITLPVPAGMAVMGVFGVYVNGQCFIETRDWTRANNVITLTAGLPTASDIHVEYFVDTLGNVIPPPVVDMLWTDDGTVLSPISPGRNVAAGGELIAGTGILNLVNGVNTGRIWLDGNTLALVAEQHLQAQAQLTVMGQAGIGGGYIPWASLCVVGTIPTSTGFAYGEYVGPTLTAQANNDRLEVIRIQGNFNDGGFTGVAHLGLFSNAPVRIETLDAASSNGAQTLTLVGPSVSVTGAGILRFIDTDAGGGTWDVGEMGVNGILSFRAMHGTNAERILDLGDTEVRSNRNLIVAPFGQAAMCTLDTGGNVSGQNLWAYNRQVHLGSLATDPKIQSDGVNVWLYATGAGTIYMSHTDTTQATVVAHGFQGAGSSMAGYGIEFANIAQWAYQGMANAWNVGSAAAGKSNIRELEHDPLAIVNDPTLHAVSYDLPSSWTPPDPAPGSAAIEYVTQVGFIADDWLPVLPEVVSVVEGQVRGMSYDHVVAIVFEALKQYIAQTDARLAALEGTP